MTAVPLVPGLPDQPPPAPADPAAGTRSEAGAWAAWSYLLLRGLCLVVLAWLVTSLLWTVAPIALGLSPTLVMSGSMAPSIHTGDVVLTTPVTDDGPGRLRKGAVVLADNPAGTGEKLLHRVVALDGTTLTTKGDANPSADSTPIARRQVDGVGRLLVPFVGRAVVWAHDGQLVGVALSGAALLALVAAVASRGPSRLATAAVVTALVLCTATALGANGASAAWVASAPTGLSTVRSWEFPAQQVMWQGDNAWGQGGGTDTVRNQTPRAVTTPSASGWSAVAGSRRSTCSINAGRLFCMGQNFDGNSGSSAGTNRTGLPAQVGSVSTWTSLSAGVNSWCAIRTDKSLWCWGENAFGQLGLNDTTTRPTPVKVGNASWEQVAMGDFHSCGIQTGGTLWCWGANDRNQLGDGTVTYRYAPVQIGSSTAWTHLDGGNAHECGLQGSPGTLWCWGWNADGQLGLNSTSNATAPTQVGSSTWTDVAAGWRHTCATRTSTLQCTGDNSSYQLGNGTTTNRLVLTNVTGGATTWTQLSSTDETTCALRDTGALFCWGLNAQGQAGVGSVLNPTTFVAASSEVNDVQTPAQVTGTWSSVDVGGDHSCALASGALRCWGDNQYGQLGAGSFDITSSPDPVPVESTATPWVSISGGVSHACGIKKDRTLWCWGDNAAGQLGQGDTVDRGSPTQVGGGTTWVRVSSGTEYSCATRTDTSLWCWGAGASGRLGNGGTSNQPSPVQVTGTGWSVPALGNGNTCATKIDTTMFCWGVNNNGQLGLGSTTAQTSPTQVSGTGWWDVVTNGSHACAVKLDTTLWCWGLNNLGQVGDATSGTNRTSPVQLTGSGWDRVEIGAYHSCARKSDRSLWCWGGNQRGQVGVGDTTQRTSPQRVTGSWTDVVDLAVNGSFSCAVRAAGAVWCWGKNNDGQLGLGTVAGTADQNVPVRASAAVSGTRIDDGLETLYVISPSRSYEAEEAVITDGAVLTAPASRGRTAGYLDNAGSSVDFTVTAASAGNHTVRVYYASSGASTQTLTVNGGGARTVSYADTGHGWGQHQPSQVVVLTVALVQGANHLVFTKGTSSTEIDRLTVDPPP